MNAHKVSPAACPGCGHILTMATGIGRSREASPKPGDVSLCVCCAAVLAFEVGGGLRVVSDEDLADLGPRDVDLLLAARAQILARKDWSS